MRYPSNTQYTSRNSFHHQHYCVPVGNSTSHTLHHHHPSSLSTEAVAWPCVTGCRLSKLSSFQRIRNCFASASQQATLLALDAQQKMVRMLLLFFLLPFHLIHHANTNVLSVPTIVWVIAWTWAHVINCALNLPSR